MDHIEVFPDAANCFRYRVRAANGKLSVPSQAYTRRWSAKRAALRWFPLLPVEHIR